MLTIENIAEICHEANRVYCRSIGDNSQLPWNEAPEWQKQSAINGVKFHYANPNAGPSGSHENWMKEKEAAGWVYGPVKDVEKKQHPCMVQYGKLPENQRRKDALFVGIIRAICQVIPAQNQ